MRAVFVLLLICHGVAAAAPGKLLDTSTRDAVRIVGKDVPARDIPSVAAHLGLPVEGTVDVDIEVAVPAGDYSRATGKITVACTKCRIGDDVAKLKPNLKSKRNSEFAANGIDFGHLEIDRFEAQIAIDKGRLLLKDWKVVSKDLELQFTLAVELGARFADSKVRGCLKFRPTEALRKREPKTHAAISTTGAAIGPDQLFHITLEGTLGEIKKLAREC